LTLQSTGTSFSAHPPVAMIGDTDANRVPL
jgi:hypothetical protein